jgi:hypothetical protein
MRFTEPLDYKMENMNYVYSTLAANTKYCLWEKSHSGTYSIPKREVLIRGGTGIADKNFITPQGVVTAVSDSDLKILEADKTFQLHKKNGFITVIEKKSKPVEKVVKDLNFRDPGRTKTPEDYRKAKNKGQLSIIDIHDDTRDSIE